MLISENVAFAGDARQFLVGRWSEDELCKNERSVLEEYRLSDGILIQVDVFGTGEETPVKTAERKGDIVTILLEGYPPETISEYKVIGDRSMRQWRLKYDGKWATKDGRSVDRNDDLGPTPLLYRCK